MGLQFAIFATMMTADLGIFPNPPRVKVVVSIYRPDPAYFEAQLRSLVNQTYKRIWIYLCVDGDPSVLSIFAPRFQDPRIQWHDFAKNVGVCDAFMRGLQTAVDNDPQPDDLFAFCDQDDVWHLEKIEKQVAFIREERVDLCHCDANLIDENGLTIGRSMVAGANMALKDRFPSLLLFNNVTGMTALFCRRVALAAVNPPSIDLTDSIHFLHDWWVALIAAAVSRIGWLPHPLVDYRQHQSNVAGVAFRHRGQKQTAVQGTIAAVLSDAKPYFAARQRLAAELLRLDRDGRLHMPWRRRFFLRFAFFRRAEFALFFLSLTLLFLIRGDRVLAGGYMRLAIGKIRYSFTRTRDWHS